MWQIKADRLVTKADILVTKCSPNTMLMATCVNLDIASTEVPYIRMKYGYPETYLRCRHLPRLHVRTSLTKKTNCTYQSSQKYRFYHVDAILYFYKLISPSGRKNNNWFPSAEEQLISLFARKIWTARRCSSPDICNVINCSRVKSSNFDFDCVKLFLISSHWDFVMGIQCRDLSLASRPHIVAFLSRSLHMSNSYFVICPQKNPKTVDFFGAGVFEWVAHCVYNSEEYGTYR